ncbi:MAG TPA: hypothetical protein VH187_15520 [Scandinavium sp.]|jgi:hypothetical protein|uniref:hypothetical protein n=1 Tax=Scandinavium sp. TaxID=2830653 RepID=UPI002E31624D|nr:hypothetical protein [Scandinavium sp.]HEX4502546.1 hypothetical protein [Scandinavium sp.]
MKLNWVLLVVSFSCFATTFENEHFKIEIDTDSCSDTDLVCTSIPYHSVNKRDGSSLVIDNGRTYNVGPYRNFRGYTFTHGHYTYLLRMDLDSTEADAWRLNVFKGNSLLILDEPITINDD